MGREDVYGIGQFQQFIVNGVIEMTCQRVFMFMPEQICPRRTADNERTAAEQCGWGFAIRADDEEHAIDLANDTIYGLNASVFTHDADRARSVAARLRSGTVGQNAFRTDFGLSFGGFKQSGLGRELGPDAHLAFTETKNVFISTTE